MTEEKEKKTNSFEDDSFTPTEGIEVCEDKCPCGGSLRLHTHVFGKGTPSKKTMYYVDCDKYCGRVVEWKDTPEEAIEAFDEKYPFVKQEIIYDGPVF